MDNTAQTIMSSVQFPSHINIRVHMARDHTAALVEVVDESDLEPFLNLGKCYDGDSNSGSESALDEYLNKREATTLVIDLRNIPLAKSTSSRFRIRFDAEGGKVPLHTFLWEHASHIKIVSPFSISFKDTTDSKAVGHHTMTYSKVCRTDFTDKFMWQLCNVEETLIISPKSYALREQLTLLAFRYDRAARAPIFDENPNQKLTAEALSLLQCHFLFPPAEYHHAATTCVIAPFEKTLEDYGRACQARLSDEAAVMGDQWAEKSQTVGSVLGAEGDHNDSKGAMVYFADGSLDHEVKAGSQNRKAKKTSEDHWWREEAIGTYCEAERSMQWE
jgi:hypothetical protein